MNRSLQSRIAVAVLLLLGALTTDVGRAEGATCPVSSGDFVLWYFQPTAGPLLPKGFVSESLNALYTDVASKMQGLARPLATSVNDCLDLPTLMKLQKRQGLEDFLDHMVLLSVSGSKGGVEFTIIPFAVDKPNAPPLLAEGSCSETSRGPQNRNVPVGDVEADQKLRMRTYWAAAIALYEIRRNSTGKPDWCRVRAAQLYLAEALNGLSTLATGAAQPDIELRTHLLQRQFELVRLVKKAPPANFCGMPPESSQIALAL